MPKWIASLIGKYLKGKIKLEDGMNTKSWWKSKNVWTGIVAILLAGYSAASSSFGLPAVPEWIFAILGTLGIYTRVTATQKIG